MFKRIVGVIAPVVLIASLAGCSDSSNDYEGICIDQNTQQRVDDNRCGYDYSVVPVYPYGFYYYPVWVSAPAVGYHVTPGGYATRPAGSRMTKTRVPSAGGVTKPKAAQPKTNTGNTNKNKTGTYNQPPKSNGGSGPKAAPPRVNTGSKPR